MNILDFVRTRIDNEPDVDLAAHMGAILHAMAELAESADSNDYGGCYHDAAALRTGLTDDDCDGRTALERAIVPLARVWADHPDFRVEWGSACDRCHAVAFDVRPHRGFSAHGIPCGCDPVPLCGDCLSHHNEEFLASVREIRANRTRKILGPPVPGAADTRFTFTTSEAGDALRDGGA